MEVCIDGSGSSLYSDRLGWCGYADTELGDAPATFGHVRKALGSFGGL